MLLDLHHLRSSSGIYGPTLCEEQPLHRGQFPVARRADPVEFLPGTAERRMTEVDSHGAKAFLAPRVASTDANTNEPNTCSHVATATQLIGALAGLAALCAVVPQSFGARGGGRQARDPPGRSPERESSYPFRYWTQDLLARSILATDMEPAQQTSAIILQLGGAAREMVRNMSYQDITQGGLVGGAQADPVTFLLAQLAHHFAPLGEESRLQAMTELMSFHRTSGEAIDAMLSRFMTLRYRASSNGVGMAMSYEGYSWLLLRACRPNSQQLLNLLQPFQGQFIATEAHFNNLQMALRRTGHILENAHGNIASNFTSVPARQFFGTSGPAADSTTPAAAADPWHQGGGDPRGSGGMFGGQGQPAVTPLPQAWPATSMQYPASSS